MAKFPETLPELWEVYGTPRNIAALAGLATGLANYMRHKNLLTALISGGLGAASGASIYKAIQSATQGQIAPTFGWSALGGATGVPALTADRLRFGLLMDALIGSLIGTSVAAGGWGLSRLAELFGEEARQYGRNIKGTGGQWARRWIGRPLAGAGAGVATGTAVAGMPGVSLRASPHRAARSVLRPALGDKAETVAAGISRAIRKFEPDSPELKKAMAERLQQIVEKRFGKKLGEEQALRIIEHPALFAKWVRGGSRLLAEARRSALTEAVAKHLRQVEGLRGEMSGETLEASSRELAERIVRRIGRPVIEAAERRWKLGAILGTILGTALGLGSAVYR